jgi:hypothetical protein
MKIAQPVPRRRSALLSLDVMATSSAGVEDSRSGPRNFALRSARGTAAREHGDQVDGLGDQRAWNGDDGFLDELLEVA